LPDRFSGLGDALEAMAAAGGRAEFEGALCGANASSLLPESTTLTAPLDLQEVWAAGVTYQRSVQAREDESKQSGVYDRVYHAERPEVFFKATPHRVVGPEETHWFRADSTWNVPEPELALVLSPSLKLAGFTVGNDMSSRSIEGENPLYLPQAKVHLRCCSLGPSIIPVWQVADPAAVSIQMSIQRDGEVAFSGQTSTSRMKRKFAELIDYIGRHNSFPHGVFLLTGTGIVPPDGFTLEHGDVISISIDGIGTLTNRVERAPA